MSTAGSWTVAEIAVVIVTYRSAKDLPLLIDSLHAEAEQTAMRVIVADNRSDDSTLKLARADPDVIAVDTGDNLAYAAGINRVMAYADDIPVVLVLNPDILGKQVVSVPNLRALAGVAAPLICDARGEIAHSLRNEPSLIRMLTDALLGLFWMNRPEWLSEFIREDTAYRVARRMDWATGGAIDVPLSGAWDAADQGRRHRECGAA